MKESISNRAVWHQAALAGIVFGLFSGACFVVRQLLRMHWGSALGISLVNILLWLLEFCGCIYLMIRFMKGLVAGYDGVTRAHTFAYGRRIALCSALIFAAIEVLVITTFARDFMETSFDEVLSAYSGMLNANARSMVGTIRDSMPRITFFSQFIYCWIYGVILSAILSRNIPREDPFAGTGTPEER